MRYELRTLNGPSSSGAKMKCAVVGENSLGHEKTARSMDGFEIDRGNCG